MLKCEHIPESILNCGVLQLIVVCVSLGFTFRAVMDFLTIFVNCLDGIGPVFIPVARVPICLLYSLFHLLIKVAE